MDAHDLYGLPLERFIPERAALAKAQRSEGRREEAAATAKLAKPSVAAWAVNQLMRTQKRGSEELFEAGDAVQAAQDAVIAGRGDGRALREAAERERASVEQLMRAARGLLSSEGHGLSPTTLERVSDTLHAAALDPDAREQVNAGCLTRELRHVGVGGFGLGDGLPAPPPADRAAPAPKKPDEAQAQRARELKAARQAETAARRAAQRAARDLDTARVARDRAADALQEAEQELAQATERAQEAAAQLREAEVELTRLEQQ